MQSWLGALRPRPQPSGSLGHVSKSRNPHFLRIEDPPKMCVLEIRALAAGPFGNSGSGSVCMCVHVCVHLSESFYGS